MNRSTRLTAAVLLMALIPGVSFAKSEEPEAEAEESKDGKKKAKIIYVELDPSFVTNFTDDKIRYLRTDVSVKVSSEKTKAAIRDHLFAIRHHMVMLLNRQTEQDLRSVEGRLQLQKDAASEMIAVLESEHTATDVDEVLFTSFVIE